MTIQIIIKGKAKYGKTRAEIAENLRKDGIDPAGSLFSTREAEEKGRWIDKKEKLRSLDENQARKLSKYKNPRSEI